MKEKPHPNTPSEQQKSQDNAGNLQKIEKGSDIGI
jgi:hypothetical protein